MSLDHSLKRRWPPWKGPRTVATNLWVMRHLRVAIVLLVLIAAAGGWWMAQRSDAARRDILSGIIETRQVSLGSKIAGRVKEVFVREGDSVRSGEVLLTFESEDYASVVRDREAALSDAEAKLRLLEAGTRPEQVARLEAAASEARVLLRKLEAGSRPQEIATAHAAYQQAQAELRKLLSGNRPQEIEQARAAYLAAEAEYRKAVAGPRAEDIDRARAQLQAATAERERAEQDALRYRALFAKSAVSKQQMEATDTRFAVAREQEEVARQTLTELLRGSREEDIEASRARMEQAAQSLKLAQEGPRKEDIEAARKRVAQAEQSLLLAVEGPRREDVEAARHRLNQAQAALAEARNGPRPQELDSARAAVARARAALEQSRVNLDEATVRAPGDGIVQKMDLRPGDFVPLGREVAVLQPTDDLWVKVYVPEDRLGSVRVGNAVSLRADGFPTERFHGVVEFISTQAEFTPRNVQTPEERLLQVFAVKIRLQDPSCRLRAGMSVEVRLSELAPR